jgi:hypothetical protein
MLLTIEAFLVCITRIYLYSHDASNIGGGALLGLFIVLAKSLYTNSIYANTIGYIIKSKTKLIKPDISITLPQL